MPGNATSFSGKADWMYPNVYVIISTGNSIAVKQTDSKLVAVQIYPSYG